MKRWEGLILIAVFTLVVIFFFTHPEFLDKVWLWIIGFAGYIIVLIQNGYKAMAKAFKGKNEPDPAAPSITGSTFLNRNKNIQTQIEAIEERVLRIESQLKNKK